MLNGGRQPPLYLNTVYGPPQRHWGRCSLPCMDRTRSVRVRDRHDDMVFYEPPPSHLVQCSRLDRRH